MASRIPRFTRQISREVLPADPTAGAEFDELQAELERFSENRQRQLDRQAEEQGFQAGLEAGSQGGDPTANDATLRGRAFNQGAIVAHQAAIQTDLRDTVDRFELAHQADPEGFDTELDATLEGLLEEADPQFHAFIRMRAADYAGRAKTRILERQHNELTAAAAADLERGADGMFRDATTAAFEGDIAMIEARRQELDLLLEQGVASQLLDEGAATELKARFERDVTAQEVVGNFDRVVRDQGIEAGTAAIQRWQATKPSSVGLSPEEHEGVTRQMVTLKNRQESLLADTSTRQSAALRAERNTRQGRVEDATAVLRAGFTPDKEQAEQVAQDIAWLMSTGEADDQQRAGELAHAFDVANAIQGTVAKFRRAPAQARDAELARLEASLREAGASTEEVELLKALKEADGAVTRGLETDARGFLQREGLIEDAPLDFSGAEQLAGSIASRTTDVAQALTGGQPVPKFTAAEADQLANVYQEAELEEKVALLGVISSGAGPDAEATLEQLDAKGHKQMALLGSFVMAGQGQVARDVLRGEALLGAEPAMKPGRVDSQPTIDDVWQGAMADWPEQRALYRDAAFAKYAELKARAGDLSDVYEPKLMEQALQAVMPTARFNGRRVAIPAGISEDGFEDWTEAWDATTFAGIAGADPGELLELVRDDGRLVELGNGRYGVAIASAATGRDRPLVREDGEPFVLQFPRGE